MDKNLRCAGILFPIASLPGRLGIGDFGASARKFADLLHESGYKIWQILPLNPLGYGHSPYQPFSSYAIEELYIDLDALADRGLIERPNDFHKNDKRIAYETVRDYKFPYLIKAFKKETAGDYAVLEKWLKEGHEQIRSYGYFMSLKRKNAMASWDNWTKEEKTRGKLLPKLKGDELEAYWFEIWLQKTLIEQYTLLHEYCNRLGISIIGDVPFYVGYDSCDVYTHDDCFLLDEELKPTFIAGVPPDYFSKTGQRWGNPMYDWDHLEKTDFAFIEERLAENAKLYDIVRLDHFRAFDTYWKIPSSCPTAIEGEWIEAPGYKFFDLFLRKHPDANIIAEDLGDLRPEVLVLRDHYDFPGMNVVEFTFFEYAQQSGKFLDKENMAAYLGTHDNDTMKGYLDKMEEADLALWKKGMELANLPTDDLVESSIEFLLSLKAKWAILNVYDLLKRGSEARINVPGIVDDVNWTYREPDFAPVEKALKASRALLEKYNRL